MGFPDRRSAGSPMTIPKYRAAIVVFLVGFALGLSVFVASRLFVRSVLSSDAVAAAEELAAQLAAGKPIEASGALSSVVRYTYFDLSGNVVASDAPLFGVGSQPDAERNRGRPPLRPCEGRRRDRRRRRRSQRACFGLSESAVKGVAVPVAAEGQTLGALIVEGRPDAGASVARRVPSASSAWSTVGLAVLAVIAVAFVVTRGRGFSQQRKAFDPSMLPRDPLTDVPTRSGLAMALDDAVERAAASDQQVGLMIIGLRRIPRRQRHLGTRGRRRGAADHSRAAEAPSPADPAGVARIAGDEFALIVEGDADRIPCASSPTESARRSANPSRSRAAQSCLARASAPRSTRSTPRAANVLFRAADSALSKAKAQGRNSLAFFDTEMKEKHAAQRRAGARPAPGARAATSSSSSTSRSSSSRRGGCAATRRWSAGNVPAKAFFRRATSWPSPRRPA